MPPASPSRPIPLHAISTRQRRLVVRHLPLVHLTLNRFLSGRGGLPPARDACDLSQEGVLALIDAIRSHCPDRHGDFAPYAMARMRHALGRHTHEDRLIRVPYTTHRKHRRRQAEKNRHNPHAPIRITRRSCYERHRGGGRAQIAQPHPAVAGRLRQLIDRCVSEVAAEMSAAAKSCPERSTLIARCAAERWAIPDSDDRTPIRALARELDCSLGRITRCEARFHRAVAERLADDPCFQEMLRLFQVRRNPREHPCHEPEWPAEVDRFAGNDQPPEP